MISERVKEYRREWKKRNPEKIKLYMSRRKKAKSIYDKIYNKKNREKKLQQHLNYYYSHTEELISKAKKWRNENKEKCRVSANNWKKRNRYKRKAHWRIKHRIDAKTIKKLPCVICGNNKVEGHHTDYRSSYKVIWLCRQHHKEVHRKYNRLNLSELISMT